MRRTITVVTGEKGSGKTTLCRRIAEHAAQRGLDAAGVVSPARFAGGTKTGIDVLDVRTGEQHALAEADEQPAALRTAKYRFDAAGLHWGAARLAAACPCDVLLVDELGPLELERGQGWVHALDILRAGQYGLAVVVVRPGLLGAFRSALGPLEVDVLALPVAEQADFSPEDLLAALP